MIEWLRTKIGDDYTAYLMVVLGNVLWVFGLSFAAENKLRVDYIHANICRGVMTCILCGMICRSIGDSLAIAHEDFWTLVIRNILNGLYCLALSFSMPYLSPPIVHTLASSGPIMVFVLDYFINGVSISKKQLGGILLTFLGLASTVNSNYILHVLGFETDSQSKYEYVKSSLAAKAMVSLLLYVTVSMWALSIVLVKRLKKTAATQLNYHAGIVLLFMSAPLVFFNMPNQAPIEQSQLSDSFLGLIGTGAPMALASLIFLKGIKMSKKSGSVAIVDFVAVPYGYLISIVRYDETPNPVGVFGSLTILIGLIFVLMKQQ